MFLVVNIFNRLIPTGAALSALVTLLRRWATKSHALRPARCQPKLFGQRGRRWAVHHIGRQADCQIVWLTTQAHSFTHKTVLSRWQPKFNVRQSPCNLCHLFKMPDTLNVTTIVPAKETTLFLFAYQKNHHRNPIDTLQCFESFFHGGDHIRENITAFASVTEKTN